MSKRVYEEITIEKIIEVFPEMMNMFHDMADVHIKTINRIKELERMVTILDRRTDK